MQQLLGGLHDFQPWVPCSLDIDSDLPLVNCLIVCSVNSLQYFFLVECSFTISIKLTLAVYMLPGELRWCMNEQFLWPGGNCVKSGEWGFSILYPFLLLLLAVWHSMSMFKTKQHLKVWYGNFGLIACAADWSGFNIWPWLACLNIGYHYLCVTWQKKPTFLWYRKSPHPTTSKVAIFKMFGWETDFLKKTIS